MWNGHSLTLLTTMRIGTGSQPLSPAARFDNQEVGIVRQDPQKDRTNDAVDADQVLVGAGEGVFPQRIGDQHVARFLVVTAKDDKMSYRLPADIVGPPFGTIFAGAAV